MGLTDTDDINVAIELRGVELEGSLDYVGTGLPRRGDRLNGARFVDNASPWSFSIVFVLPIAPL